MAEFQYKSMEKLAWIQSKIFKTFSFLEGMVVLKRTKWWVVGVERVTVSCCWLLVLWGFSLQSISYEWNPWWHHICSKCVCPPYLFLGHLLQGVSIYSSLRHLLMPSVLQDVLVVVMAREFVGLLYVIGCHGRKAPFDGSHNHLLLVLGHHWLVS